MGTSVDAFVGRFVGAFVGVLEGLKTGNSTLVGGVVGARVGDLVGALVGPLVGQRSLSPALCIAHLCHWQLHKPQVGSCEWWSLYMRFLRLATIDSILFGFLRPRPISIFMRHLQLR